MHTHNHHYIYSQSGPVASVEITNPAAHVVSSDTNQTYQVPNPIIRTPHPTTGVIYTDINPQKTKKGQKALKEVANPTIMSYNPTC